MTSENANVNESARFWVNRDFQYECYQNVVFNYAVMSAWATDRWDRRAPKHNNTLLAVCRVRFIADTVILLTLGHFFVVYQYYNRSVILVEEKNRWTVWREEFQNKNENNKTITNLLNAVKRRIIRNWYRKNEIILSICVMNTFSSLYVHPKHKVDANRWAILCKPHSSGRGEV